MEGRELPALESGFGKEKDKFHKKPNGKEGKAGHFHGERRRKGPGTGALPRALRRGKIEKSGGKKVDKQWRHKKKGKKRCCQRNHEKKYHPKWENE